MKLILFVFIVCQTVVWGLDARWKLLWQDEFNTMDITKWAGRTQYYAQTTNYLRGDYAYVSDGKLVIKSDRKAGSPNVFETGYIDTAGMAYFTYGRFEINAKLPSGQGMLPAHWMLSETRCWPYGIEYDILELPYGLSYEPTSVHATIHYGENCGDNRSNGSKLAVAKNFFDSYHTFAMEWFPGNLTFFLDDIPYHHVLSSSINGKPWADMDPTPHHFILNSFVGGWSPAPNSSEPFPKYHYVDYVRVYGWQPCVQGCGDHGVCNNATQTCECDSDYTGTYCEFSFAEGYGTSFDARTKHDFLNSNAVIDKGLTLTINASGCPSACSYNSAQWSKNDGFGSGNFSFNLKAPNVSGYLLVAEGNGGDLSAQGFKFLLYGADNTRVAFMTSGSNTSVFVWQWITLGFNPSLDYHTYRVDFVRGHSYSVFIDDVLKFNVNDSVVVTQVHLYPRITYQMSTAIFNKLDPYTGPNSLVVKNFLFSPAPGIKLPRPATTTTTTSGTTTSLSSSTTGTTADSSSFLLVPNFLLLVGMVLLGF